ncbi:MAG: thioredoxin domain-containing protein [Candidatus Dadabacteria bacterium]|nr:thioredoxin domain-containing protein [Candidatus Dadabacteria bacterium]
MNRLSKEKSPYLLQHAGNPVDWYPWGDEAFEKAAREDKPVFVSVGYSTCHWCHVMEKESFEDAEVAALMNGALVSVKVDREERPDIDGVLMSVCQIVSRGNCGWPLNVALTPEKRPFFAATYIPKHNKFGRAGMVELIPRISEAWKTRREEIERSAGGIEAALAEAQAAVESGGAAESPEILEGAAAQIAANFDGVFGGFGGAPKFPSPHTLLFLLRRHFRTGDREALAMAEKTLGAMLCGGINDHIGGGFHRYSTDRRWLTPHFEKMLYDQAMVSLALTEAWLVTGKEDYRRGARDTLEYVMRDMTAPDGGFFSAEDADSEGEEGKFYVWSAEDFNRALGGEARAAAEILNIKDGGNFTDEATGDMPGTNIAHITPGTKARLSQSAREKLFTEREKRPRPHRDDKILTDWTGLMIAAFASAARAFGEKRYLAAAENAADFITGNLLSGGRLLHRFRDGEAAIDGNLDDYAFMVWGLLELYGAGFDTARLQTAVKLNASMRRMFSGTDGGGFFFAPDGAEKLIIRKKEFHDGAMPCGNSVAAANLIKISRLTGDPSHENRALEIVRSLSLSLEKLPSSHAMLMCAMEEAAGKTMDIVIAEADDGGAQAVTDALARSYRPGATVLVKKPDDGGELAAVAPFTGGCAPADGKTAVYVCENGACGLPETAEEFAARIRAEKKC